MDDFKQLSPNEIESSHRNPFFLKKLQNEGLTIIDLLQNFEISINQKQNLIGELINRPEKEVDYYFESLYSDLNVEPTNLDDILGSSNNENQFIKTGIDEIDDDLNGGLPIGEITEIFGASGCGKSQLVFQFIKNCLNEFDDSKVIHISTETNINSTRLSDFLDNDESKMDKVSCIYNPDLMYQDHTLYTQVPIELENNPQIKLLIIDSISHHFRGDESISNSEILKSKIDSILSEFKDDNDFEELIKDQNKQSKFKTYKTEKYTQRIQKLYYILHMYRHLNRLASKFNLAVVVINQVSDYASEINTDYSQYNYEDINDPLNYDFQIPISAGWDPKSIFNLLPRHFINTGSSSINNNSSISDLIINEKDLELLDLEMERSMELLNKRQRTSNGVENYDPKNNKLNLINMFENQKELILKSYNLRNSKKINKLIPTLGYSWSMNLQNKIMICKKYKPDLKTKKEIEKESEEMADLNSIDFESGISFNELMDEINSNGKRSNPSSNTSSTNSNISAIKEKTTNSLLKGWKVERFIKVIQSSNSTTNDNNFQLHRFVIEKNRIM
ncbi:RAD57 [Candida pseudojiufengensis]|uniref:RAD57 n=1 Tax=Candida pseudojiufengensis TaxID=497109 RepID=UPI002223FDC2|nr:RAD57 [Candida pseudojiufengensis]KAI5965144.1 RAD57 [Candida pseudojiufengensis]